MSGSDSDFRAERREGLFNKYLARYLREIPVYLQCPNETSQSVLDQALKELAWTGYGEPYQGLYEKLVAKDENSWLFYLSEVDRVFCSRKYFQEVKNLSPFRDRTLYRRETRVSAIVLDPAELDGVRIL